MSSMLIKFIDGVTGKYGSRMITTSQPLLSNGRELIRLGGKTSKGMKWIKYYDRKTEKLVAYEQSYNGKAKMVVYNSFDNLLDNPVNVVKLPKNGRVDKGLVSRNESYKKYCLLDYLHGLTEDICFRFGSVNKEMCTGHSWFF